MKKLYFTLFYLGLCLILTAQCPDLTTTSVNPNCIPSCELCQGSTLTINATGGDLPTNGKIEYYYSDIPGFDPYNGEGNLFGMVNTTTTNPPCRICPTLSAFMIDACGTENLNEFVIIWTGSGFNTSNFNFDYDANNNFGGGNADIGSGGCSLVSGNTALVTGCNATAVGSGVNLEPNAILIVFTSAGANNPYDFSAVCGDYCKVYVASSSCGRSIGAFSNGTSTGLRTQTFSVTGCGCSTTVIYDTDDPGLGGNGDSWANGLGNFGCSAPPISPPSYTPASSSVPAFNFIIPATWCDQTYEIVGVVKPRPDPVCCMDEFTDRFTISVKCPKANIASLSVCDNGNGQATFILEDAETDILGNGMGTVQWFRDMAGTQVINSPYVSSPVTVYARVKDGNCFSMLVPVMLKVIPLPIARTATEEQCDEGGGVATFLLTGIENTIKGGNPSLSVNFFQDINKTIPITPPFTSGSISIYATVFNADCESKVVEIKLIVNPVPEAHSFSIELCDEGDGKASFDLRQNSVIYKAVTGNIAGNNVSFYLDDQLTIFLNIGQYRFESMIVYAVVSNNKCKSGIVEINLKVIQLTTPPIISDKICDDGTGQAFLDLKLQENLYTGGDTSIKVTWYYDSLKIDSVKLPYKLIGIDTLYAFIKKGNCVSKFSMLVLDFTIKPKAFTASIIACSDSLGFAEFDLNILLIQISGGRNLIVDFARDSLLQNLIINRKFKSLDDSLYAFTKDGSCYSYPVKVYLKSLLSPQLVRPNDTSICGIYVIPTLMGINLGAESYFFIDSNSFQKKLNINDTLIASNKLFLISKNNQCIDLDSFNINLITPSSSGENITVSICDGSVLDLRTILKNADTTGSFVDLDNSGSLFGSLFNSIGKNGSNFRFTYITPSLDVCPPDTSMLTIQVVQSVSGGIDTVNTYCESEVINLFNLLRQADGGGSLKDPLNTGALSGNSWNSQISGPGIFQLTYEVGDGIVCPKDAATLQLHILPEIKIIQPGKISACSFVILPAIQGKNIRANSSYYTSTSGMGIKFNTGDTIFSSIILYIFGQEAGYCSDEINVEIDIKDHVTADFIQNNLCPDATFFIGQNNYNKNKPSGTETLAQAAFNGCDSIINIFLNFLPEAVGSLKLNFCPNEFLLINGKRFDQINPIGTEIIQNGSINGCDSLIQIELNYYPISLFKLTSDLCEGDQIQINNKLYDANNLSGSDTLRNGSQVGCDSIININLNLIPNSHFRYRDTLCYNETVNLAGYTFSRSNNQLIDTLENGSLNTCDSIIDIKIDFLPEVVSNYNDSFCENQFILIQGNRFDKNKPNGTEVLRGASYSGCDSLVFIQLSFKNSVQSSVTSTLCTGESIIINNKLYHENNRNGIDTIKSGSAAGCDSIINIALQFIPNSVNTYSEKLCPDEFVRINGKTFDIHHPNGVELLKSAAVNGCDSTIIIDLKFPSHQLNYTREYSLIPGTPIQLDVNIDFTPFKIEWSTTIGLSCHNCLNPIANPTETTQYMVSITDSLGCILTAEILINLDLKQDVYTPNIFSPNGDNVNDVFKIQSNNELIILRKFSIFDRWGELVYLEEGSIIKDQKGWNGLFKNQAVNPGVYIYFVEMDIPGKGVVILKGDVSVIR